MNKTVSKDGTVIAYDRMGNGPAIVLVDGALCSRALGPMGSLMPFLADHFTVFHFDRRGRNESTDARTYEVKREIEDIGAVIREAGGSASLFGLSSGACLSLHAAATGNYNIEKLVLYEPPFVAGAGNHHPPADHRDQLTRLISEDRRGDAVAFFLVKVTGMPAGLVAIMRLLPVWSKLKSVAHTLVYDASIMGDYSLPISVASLVNIPALVIGGAKSPTMLRQVIPHLANAMPNAQHRLLEGQTHNVSPKSIAPILIEFFKA